jgi:TolB-like protein/Flp pilus assembly protein TadD
MAEGGGDERASGSTPLVFISYASQDTAVADAVVEALERNGLQCWIAPRDVTPGASYAGQIIHAIDAVKASVLILTQDAASSPHVLREVERAASKRHPIVSLRIDQAPLPADFEYFLNTSHWLDTTARDMGRALPKLVAAVRVALQAPAVTPAGSPTANARAPSASARLPKRTAIVMASVVGLAILGWAADRLWLSSRRGVANPVLSPIASAPTSAAAAPTISERSIAVLPFTDMSEKKDQEYFGDGMAEEILDLLAKIPDLTVIGRTSSFQFKGRSEDLRLIGEKLRVAYVVEGSVRKAGPRIRVTAQLIDARTGSHIWSNSYDRDFGDVLTLQDEIATGITRALQLAVGADDTRPVRRLQNQEAYTLYLRGLSFLDSQHEEQLAQAKNYFEQALALDPSMLRAAEALALTYVASGLDENVPAPTAWQQAKAAAERALRIDSNSATAHAVLGFVHAYDEFDWKNAEAEFGKALSLNPRDPVTLYLAAGVAYARVQRIDALQRINGSLALDPLNPYAQQALGEMLLHSGDLAGAESALRQSLAISPSFDESHLFIAEILLLRGHPEAALAQVQAESAADAKVLGLVLVNHALGRHAESDAALVRLTRNSAVLWPYAIALAHAYRGEVNEAFEWMEKAYELRDAEFIFSIHAHPMFERLRGDPRYKELVRKMNLQE